MLKLWKYEGLLNMGWRFHNFEIQFCTYPILHIYESVYHTHTPKRIYQLPLHHGTLQ